MERVRFQLDNGMIVLAKGMPSRRVNGELYVGCGAAYDSPNLQGRAHFFEHMPFRGLANRPDFDLQQELASYGGAFNGRTCIDHTVYEFEIFDEDFSSYLNLLAQQVFAPTLEKKEVDNERRTIISEQAMRTSKLQGGREANKWFREKLYGEPFDNDPIGRPEHILEITPEDLSNLHSAFYTPNNMILAIAGGIPENFEETVKKSFGQYEPKDVKRPVLNQKPIVGKQKKAFEVEGRRTAAVAFVWGGPDIRSPEKPAFDVAQMLLCGGFNSRLMRSLRYEKGLVYSVAGQQLPIMGATSVVVEAECNPKDIDAVIDTIENDSRQLADEPAEEGELKAARNNLRIGTLKFMELQSSVPRMMTCREVYDHDPEAYFVSLGNITAQDVQQVVKKYLDADNYLLAVLLP